MSLKQFIFLGRIEAVSALVLFGIAMPLKYLADIPEAVKYVGWVHGLLFVIYVGALIFISFQRKWSLGKILLLFIAAWIPGGPLLFEKRLHREEKRNQL